MCWAALSGSSVGDDQASPEALAGRPGGAFPLRRQRPPPRNDLSSYAITPSSGALTEASTVGAGTFPLSVVIDPAGTFAYVANQNSNDVSVYSIDATTGVPSPRSAARPSRPGLDSSLGGHRLTPCPLLLHPALANLKEGAT